MHEARCILYAYTSNYNNTEYSVRGEAEAEELSQLEDLCEEFRTSSARYKTCIEYDNNVIHL